jgi:hypothetical protein
MRKIFSIQELRDMFKALLETWKKNTRLLKSVSEQDYTYIMRKPSEEKVILAVKFFGKGKAPELW